MTNFNNSIFGSMAFGLTLAVIGVGGLLHVGLFMLGGVSYPPMSDGAQIFLWSMVCGAALQYLGYQAQNRVDELQSEIHRLQSQADDSQAVQS